MENQKNQEFLNASNANEKNILLKRLIKSSKRHSSWLIALWFFLIVFAIITIIFAVFSNDKGHLVFNNTQLQQAANRYEALKQHLTDKQYEQLLHETFFKYLGIAIAFCILWILDIFSMFIIQIVLANKFKDLSHLAPSFKKARGFTIFSIIFCFFIPAFYLLFPLIVGIVGVKKTKAVIREIKD